MMLYLNVTANGRALQITFAAIDADLNGFFRLLA
jgi:hypothetical protein